MNFHHFQHLPMGNLFSIFNQLKKTLYLILNIKLILKKVKIERYIPST